MVPAATADVANGTYRGTATTTVRFLNPATLEVEATRRYSRKMTVTIRRPLRYAGTAETNPFNMVVNPTVAGAGLVAGDLYTATARTAITGGRTQLLQYWTMQNTQSGFTGAFTNAHALERAQRDRIVAPLGDPDGALKPYRLRDASFGPAFQVNASGLVSGNQMTLTIAGHASVKAQAIVSFQTVITAKKKGP